MSYLTELCSYPVLFVKSTVEYLQTPCHIFFLFGLAASLGNERFTYYYSYLHPPFFHQSSNLSLNLATQPGSINSYSQENSQGPGEVRLI